MPSKNLDLLKALDTQLASLDKIVKGGDYYGAGLDITVQVLPRHVVQEDDDDDAPMSPCLQLQLTHDVDELMALFRKSLVARREVVAAAARGELAELKDFLAGETPPVPPAA